MTPLPRPFSALAAGLTLALAAVAVAVGAPTASAQQKTTRVAIVDPSRCFNEMQETKDLRVQLESERQRLAATAKEKETEIDNLGKQRDPKVMRPDSPQAEAINKQLLQKAMEYEVWSKYAKLDAERTQKKQMRTLFAKIEATTAEVAKQQGIDIVISDQSPDLPDSLDKITIEQLRGALNSKQVMYAADSANITNAVIASLDAKYKAGGAAAPAAPAPAAPAPAAPAPAPAPAGKK